MIKGTDFLPVPAEGEPPQVTRFAPSPSGYLHLGHAYSALFGFEAARISGGRFLLRIEDIDRQRSRPEFEHGIYEDLSWLGIVWDGQVRRQSEHLDVYRATLDELRRLEVVYPCFCSRRQIRLDPAPQQERVEPAHPSHRQLREVHVGGDRGVAFGVGDVVGVAVDRCPHVWSGAAVVGVSVSQHHPLDAAELLRRRPRLAPHRLGPGVELDHPVAVLDEVDVHRPAEVPAQQPDSIGDSLQPHVPRVTPARVPRVPWIWKAGMIVLIVCLIASMVIAIVRLSTTPTEILGDGFRGLPAEQAQQFRGS